MKKEKLNTSIPSLHFKSRSGMLNHIGGTYSHNGMMHYPRIPFSELNLGKFPHSMEFQKLESQLSGLRGLSTNSRSSDLTMHWIEEVEIAKVN